MSADRDPALMMRRCQCGRPTCNTVVFAMLRPVIESVKENGKEELASLVHFPLEHAQSFVNELRRLAAERGVTIL